MKAFAFAAIAGAVSALDWSDVTDFVETIPLKRSDVKVVSHKKIVLSEYQRSNVNEAHHNIRAQRERLGLARVGAGPNVMQTYENLNGFLGSLLGVADGLMYHPGSVSNCFTAVEGALISLDSLANVVQHIYLPWYWSEFQMVLQDEISLQAALYADCDVDKFFNTMTHLVTWEGVSELAARAAGGFFFEFQDLLSVWDSSEVSSFGVGQSLGRVVGTIADYHI